MMASLGEADPRHAELIRKSFGVTGRSVALASETSSMTLKERFLSSKKRAQYLSSDRPEIQVECRDLARKMQQPSNLGEMGLKR